LAEAFLSYPSWPKLPPADRIKRTQEEAAFAVSLDERNASAHRILGYVESWSWHWDEARKQLLRALELRPEDAAARFLWAQYLAVVGDMAGARTKFDRARRDSPDNFYVAPLCLWLRDYPCTIAGEHQAMTASASPRQVGARPAFVAQCAGVAYVMTGHFEEAVQQFQYGVDHTEADAGALLFLAYGLAAAKRNADAEKIVG
jgi:tetratricopeptide (TPR) repeat protein